MARVTDLTLGGRVEGGVEHHDLVQPEVAVLSPEQLAGVLGLAGSTEQEEEEEREIVGPHHDSVASMTRSGPLREGLGDLYHSTHQSQPQPAFLSTPETGGQTKEILSPS